MVVRAALPTAMDGITVWVRGGIYYLDRPLEFGPDDSGTVAVPVAYKGYTDETVVLSGAKRLTPTWHSPGISHRYDPAQGFEPEALFHRPCPG